MLPHFPAGTQCIARRPSIMKGGSSRTMRKFICNNNNNNNNNNNRIIENWILRRSILTRSRKNHTSKSSQIDSLGSSLLAHTQSVTVLVSHSNSSTGFLETHQIDIGSSSTGHGEPGNALLISTKRCSIWLEIVWQKKIGKLHLIVLFKLLQFVFIN